jgi:ABC-type glutathione transport system ATPase component
LFTAFPRKQAGLKLKVHRMITIFSEQCSDSVKNEPFLYFDNPVTFKNNTMYFIIGRSGMGKSTFLSMLTSPFTEDPIKKGFIKFDDDTFAPVSRLTGKPIKEYDIEHSKASHAAEYFKFIRRNLAYIPQTNESFHPAIPVAKQLYNLYSYAAAKPTKKEFLGLAEALSPAAGFDKITIDKDLRGMHIWDYKLYRDIDKPKTKFVIVDKDGSDREETTVFARQLSHGQRQRLLVLSALIRFEVMDNPVLLGDEFLVNFSFTEGELVLRRIIEKFKDKKNKDGNTHKTAVFVLHDLSYPCIKALKDEKDFDVKIVLIEDNKADSKQQRKIHTEIDLSSFYNDEEMNSKNYAAFREFRDSYDGKAKELVSGGTAGEAGLREKIAAFKALGAPHNGSEEIFVKNVKAFIPGTEETPKTQKILYQNLYFPIKKRTFIILTGFSGCGKSQFISHLLEEYIYDKKNTPCFDPKKDLKPQEMFRYFPSTSHESLSYGSNVTVREDLKTMYKFYNGIDSIEGGDIEDIIKKHFESVQYRINGFKSFLNKRIYTLSGGELQRYWFGRITLLKGIEPSRKPKFLVFDESISSLDCMTKDDLIATIIKDFFIGEKLSVFFVTHDLRDIQVIYRTLKMYELDERFEHYEMFGGKIFKVKTKYEDYRENAYASLHNPNVYNEYEAVTEDHSGSEEFKLKLERGKRNE